MANVKVMAVMIDNKVQTEIDKKVKNDKFSYIIFFALLLAATVMATYSVTEVFNNSAGKVPDVDVTTFLQEKATDKIMKEVQKERRRAWLNRFLPESMQLQP